MNLKSFFYSPARLHGSRFAAISLLLHIFLIFVFGGIVLFKSMEPDSQFEVENAEGFLLKAEEQNDGGSSEPLEFESAEAPAAETTPNVAAMASSLVTAQPSSFVLNSPMNTELSMGRSLGRTAMAGVSLGSGGAGTGRGKGGGSGFKFFGVADSGERTLFIVDYSQSMTQEGREPVLRSEIAKTISGLSPNAEFAFLLFAGLVWKPGDDISDLFQEWEGRRKKKEGTISENVRVPKVPWIRMNESVRAALLKAAAETPLMFGTDWKPPFKAAFAMSPRPDVICFMTDGVVSNADEVRKWIEHANRNAQIKIHTIAFGEPKAADALKAISDSSGGQFRIIETKAKGKPHKKPR